MTLRGMTWDHPRAWRPLEAFQASGRAPAVRWDRQSLADFEAFPIDRLAQRYDLMVIDHPGLPAALDALTPLEELIDPATLAVWTGSGIGASGRSYEVEGRTWAVPIDAAAQVAVRRADAAVPPVRRWEDVPAIAAGHRMTLCLGGPHAGLMLLAMCSRPQVTDRTLLLDPGTACAALELLRACYALADPGLSLQDPIAVHDELAAGDRATWCPLAYGYVSYADTLTWSDAPTWRDSGPLSVLGGTGLAVSAHTAHASEAADWLSAYLDEGVQTELVPRAGGQPAHSAVWERGGAFYAAMRETVAQAWVRPQARGWIALQDEMSEITREAVLGRRDLPAAITAINDEWQALQAKEDR